MHSKANEAGGTSSKRVAALAAARRPPKHARETSLPIQIGAQQDVVEMHSKAIDAVRQDRLQSHQKDWVPAAEY
jgi:hypothetical protein